MNKIITGLLLAMPLAMTALPGSASALQVVVRPQVQNYRPVQVAKAKRKVWVSGHWVQQGRRRVWVPAHYEWRN